MPNNFTPLNPRTDMPNMVAQLNKNFAKLDNESVVKVFKRGQTTAVIQGRYADNRYGTIYSDEDGVRRILIGQAPDDGRPGIWISREGEDVITLLGG